MLFRSLVSLDIQFEFVSTFTNQSFRSIVSRWPRLQKLVLDRADTVCAKSQEITNLTLEGALRALAKYCPQMQVLSVYLSPTCRPGYVGQNDTDSTGSHGQARAPRRLPHLRDIAICAGLPVPLSDISEVQQVVGYLDVVLPRDCTLKWHLTGRSLDRASKHDDGWGYRLQQLIRFHSIMSNCKNAWSVDGRSMIL